MKWWHLALIGGGVVLVVGVILGIAYCWWRRKRQKPNLVEEGRPAATPVGGKSPVTPAGLGLPASDPSASVIQSQKVKSLKQSTKKTKKKTKSAPRSATDDGSGEFTIESDQSFKTQEVLQLKKRILTAKGKSTTRGKNQASVSVSVMSRSSQSPQSKKQQPPSTGSPSGSASTIMKGNSRKMAGSKRAQ